MKKNAIKNRVFPSAFHSKQSAVLIALFLLAATPCLGKYHETWEKVDYPLYDEVVQTYRVVGNVSMISEGAGLEEVDSASIVISGIPDDATLIRSFLYYAGRVDPSTWDDLRFDGTLINETTTPWAKRIAETPDNGDRTVFRVDVTSLLPSDGSSLNKTYSLFPENNMSGIFGASLMIVYEDMEKQLSSVIISDGAAIVNASNSVSQGPGDPDSATEFFAQTGLVFPNELYAEITIIVSEGSVIDDTELIVIPDSGTPKNFGDLCNGSDGTNWDDVTDDFSNHLNVESTRIDMIYTDKDQEGYFADLYVFAMQYALKDGTLAGFVFNDLNRNSMYEPSLGETPLEGISITLYGESTATAWTETNAQGYWSSTGLSPETYWVFADETDPDIPDGFIFNTADNPAVVVLPDGGAISANFGWLRYPSEINFTDSSGNADPYWYAGESLYITVTDYDEDTDSQTLQTITGVSVWDERTNDSETIGTLNETSPGSGIFISSTALPLQIGTASPNDGILQVYGGDPIHCGYTDDDYLPDHSEGDGVIITSTGYTFYMTADTATVYAGGPVGYTIGILNSSSSAMTDAIVYNTIPSDAQYIAGSLTLNGIVQTDTSGDDMAEYESAGNRAVFHLPSVDPGQYVVMTMNLLMNDNLLTWTNVESQASLQSSELGIDALSDADPVVQPGDQPTVVSIVGDLAELTKDVSDRVPMAGDTIRYHMVLYNSCTQSLTGIQLTDAVPEELQYVPESLSWNTTGLTDAPSDDEGTFSSGTVHFDIPSLATGTACTLYFSARVPLDALSLKRVSNQASLTVSDPAISMPSDDDPEVEGSQTTDLEISGPWYSLLMIVTPDKADTSENVQWTIMLRNSCTIAFDAIDIASAIPDSMTYIPGSLAASGTSFTDEQGDDNGYCQNDAAGFHADGLAPGDSATFYFSSSVDPLVWTGSVLPTYADLTISQPAISGRSDQDPAVQGDQDTAVTVTGPIVKFIMNARTWARPGETVVYEMVLENTSTATLDTITVSDITPDFTSYEPGTLSFNGTSASDSADADEGTWDGSTGIAFSFSSLAPGESATMDFSLRMDADLPSGQVIENQAVAEAVTPELNKGSDSDLQTEGFQKTCVIITREPYSFLKFGPETAAPGENADYRLVLTSTTTADFDTISIRDFVPAGMQYVAGTLVRDSTPLSDAADTDEGSFAMGTIIFDISTLSSGASTTLYYTLTPGQQTAPGSVISNQADLSISGPVISGLSDADPDTQEAEAHSLLVVGEKNQVLTLKVNPGEVNPGGQLNWTLRLTNTSATLMTSIILDVPVPADTDVHPASLMVNNTEMTDAADSDQAELAVSSIRFKPPELDPGESSEMTFVLDVHSPLAAGISISTQAQMSSATPFESDVLSDGDEETPGDQVTTAEVVYGTADALIIWDNPVRDDNAVIAWNIPDAGPVQIRIFTVTGELVGQWTDLVGPSGFITWNTANLGGTRVVNGMYIVVIKAGSRDFRRKMVLVR